MELSSTQADLPWEVPRERGRGPCSHEGQPHPGCRGPHLLSIASSISTYDAVVMLRSTYLIFVIIVGVHDDHNINTYRGRQKSASQVARML